MKPTNGYRNIGLLSILVALITSTLVGTPAHAAGPTFDFTGLKLPAGASITVDKTTFEYGGTQIYISLKTPDAPANSLLKLSDVVISGLPAGAIAPSNKIDYYDLSIQYPNFSLRIAESDITQSDVKISISGTGTYELKGDLAYPKSYAATIANLEALGLEASDGYNYWSGDSRFGFYISARTKEGVAPFSLVVIKTVLGGTGRAAVNLKTVFRPIAMSSTPNEIFLGDSTTDPTINRTNTTLTSTFAKYIPSTIDIKRVKAPKGYLVSAFDFNDFIYDPITNRTSLIVEVRKSGNSTKALKITGASVAQGKVLKTLKNVAPSYDAVKNVTTYTFTIGSIAGDARIGKKLAISAIFTLVNKG